jgi:hypothetical protein
MIDPRVVRMVIEVIGSAVLAVVLFGASVDLWLERRDESLGLYLARWSRRYPLFAVALVALLGAMLGHFFTQAI